jgi:hypothetical protein
MTIATRRNRVVVLVLVALLFGVGGFALGRRGAGDGAGFRDRCADYVGIALFQDLLWLGLREPGPEQDALSDIFHRIDLDEIAVCVPELANRHCRKSDAACLTDVARRGAQALDSGGRLANHPEMLPTAPTVRPMSGSEPSPVPAGASTP